MAYSFTAQLFPAAIIAFYTRARSGTPVLCGLAAGFVTAMVFVLHIVQPPYNIHPGILGLAVNVTVLLIAGALHTGPAIQPMPYSAAGNRAANRLLFAC